MEKEIDSKLDMKSKMMAIYSQHKGKLYSFILLLIVMAISLFFLNIKSEKENRLISQKYIQAGLYLTMNKEKQALSLYDEILSSKNKFYSILALNTILEKNLETNSNKIFNYFKVIESMSLDKEQYDLIIFKKALYLIKTSKKDEGFKLLNNLIDTNSKLKNLAKTLVPID